MEKQDIVATNKDNVVEKPNIAAPEIRQLDVKDLTAVSLEKFNELQAKNGRLYVLDIEIDETEKYQFIAKRPSKSLLSAIADSKDDFDKANDLMIKNMIVAGDTGLLEDGVIFTHLIKSLAKLTKEGKSFLSKA